LTESAKALPPQSTGSRVYADAASTCSVPESSEQLLFRTSDRGHNRAGVGFHNDRKTWHFLPAACSNAFLVTQPRARKLPRRVLTGLNGQNIFNSIVDCQFRSLSPISTMAGGNRQSEMPFSRPVPCGKSMNLLPLKVHDLSVVEPYHELQQNRT